jgi:hypothetical protein
MPLQDLDLPLQQPATLPANATDAQRIAWVTQWQAYALLADAVVRQQAVAQEKTLRESSTEATGRLAEANASLASATSHGAAAYREVMGMLATTPDPRPTRAMLVWDLLKVHPQATILTAGDLVRGSALVVDAFVKAYPDAVRA